MTLSQAQQHLNQWLQADLAVANGQSYSIGDRSLTKANASEITEKIRYWQTQVNRLGSSNGSGLSVKRIIPRDL